MVSIFLAASQKNLSFVSLDFVTSSNQDRSRSSTPEVSRRTKWENRIHLRCFVVNHPSIFRELNAPVEYLDGKELRTENAYWIVYFLTPEDRSRTHCVAAYMWNWHVYLNSEIYYYLICVFNEKKHMRHKMNYLLQY